MEPLAAGQSYVYRPPQGFETSRIVIGSLVPFNDDQSIVCCSVLEAPRHLDADPGDTTAIPFLPMTEAAFRASVVSMEGMGQTHPQFEAKLHQWSEDTRGRAAFSVPYSGSIEQMIDLEFSKRERVQTGGPAERLVTEVGKLLAGGLKTQTEPFPQSQEQFEEILQALRKLQPSDVFNRLVIAGFADHPYGSERQRCLECIYFLPHRSWCDLPELDLPVEPYWWCRLWRV